jgi:heme O synthase-like polyprenyltransferase
MTEKRPLVKSTTEARQGQTTGVVRWVLGISLTLVIVAMFVTYFVS